MKTTGRERAATGLGPRPHPSSLAVALAAAAKTVLEAEVSAIAGAGHGERSPARSDRRNGYRRHTWVTPHGPIDIEIPRLRSTRYEPSWLIHHPARTAEIIGAYLRGRDGVDATRLLADLGSTLRGQARHHAAARLAQVRRDHLGDLGKERRQPNRPRPGMAAIARPPRRYRRYLKVGASIAFIAVVAVSNLAPARPAAEPLVNRLLDTIGASPSTPQAAASIAVPDGPVALGRIAIPRMGLDAQIYEGIDGGALENGPGHWPGTPLPGQPGVSILAGHRTTYTHPFRDLDRLRQGDDIVVELRGRPPVTMKVGKTTVVRESRYVAYILRDRPLAADVSALTLVACTPKGRRTHRIIVEAQVELPTADGR